MNSTNEHVSCCTVQLLVNLVRSYRYDKEGVNLELAESEAMRLHAAIGTRRLDDNKLIWILSTRNFSQLQTTFSYYRKLYGIALQEVWFHLKFKSSCIYTSCKELWLFGWFFLQDIKKCGNGVFESLLSVAIWCVECPGKHFAKVFSSSSQFDVHFFC